MLAALRTHFKREKKKGKKRKEKAFGQVGMDRAVKVFWKNTTKRVEIFSKTRRA